MHLKVLKRNGREYLSVVQSYRQDGKVRTRTIETIGYADAYTDRFDDPIAHFRAYVDQLNRNAIAERQPIELSFGFNDTIDVPAVPPARLGAAIALGCLDALGMQGFFRSRVGRSGFPVHVGRVFEMLATERMMHVTSKRESWTARESFPRPCDFTFAEVYQALSCIAREHEKIDACAMRHLRKVKGEPDVSRIFLICGSYAFPVDGGSERAGIVMAIDGDGMPLGYHTVSGRFEPQAFREAANALKERLGAGRAIIVAGGLRDIDPTIAEMAKSGDGFVLYQRNFNQDAELSSWAESEEGYSDMGGNVYMKWRASTRNLPGGPDVAVKEVVLRGGGYATRFGHAVLVCSELDLNAASIVQLYRELWRQAEPFQPLEADFSSMPYPTSAHDHIQAHFAICYASFFGLRMLRWKMKRRYNAADTADALMRMEGIHLQRNYYLFNYRSEATDCIEEAVGIPCARRLRTRQELRGVPKIVGESFGS